MQKLQKPKLFSVTLTLFFSSCLFLKAAVFLQQRPSKAMKAFSDVMVETRPFKGSKSLGQMHNKTLNGNVRVYLRFQNLKHHYGAGRVKQMIS